jgi:methyltransferase (TIGR00027 family)
MQTGAPSRTAEYMALFRALESARPAGERLFEDRAAARFLNPRLRAAADGAKLAPARAAITAYIDRRWPGPRLSGVVRTREIDDLVATALGEGCTQLLLLGAGYDTRATRLAAASAESVTVFEVDHPDTQSRKREVMAGADRRVRYVPVDFERDRLTDELDRAGFDREQRTCVLWEGVFSYLTLEAIDGTLAAILELSAADSRLVLTYLDRRALEDDTQPQAWLDAVCGVDEPFKTGLFPEEAPQFFADRGLALVSDESTTEIARRMGLGEWRSIPTFYRLATLRVSG